MVFVLPAGGGFSRVLDINLGSLVAGSQLINGFSHDLPSLALIKAAVRKQTEVLAKGGAEDTGVSANSFAASPRLGHGINALDHNSYQTAVHPALTLGQVSLLLGPNGVKGAAQGGPGGSGLVAIRTPGSLP